MKALAVLGLRFTEPGVREWRVPLNLRIGRVELPLGLAVIAAALFAIAITNLFTKQVATISGIGFTLVVYASFVASERAAARRRLAGTDKHGLDQFQLLPGNDIGLEQVQARPGNCLVPVRDYNTLAHLNWVLQHTDTEVRDLVVMTVRLLQGPDTGFRDLREDRIFTDYEQLLFTRVVALAERQGKPVKLLVIPSSNVFDAIVRSAIRLRSTEIVVGDSAKFTGAEQARLMGEAWERVGNKPEDLRTRLLAYKANGAIETFLLGPHAPTLTEEDLELIHRLWLRAVNRLGLGVHHRDIVRAALEEFDREMTTGGGEQALARIKRHLDGTGGQGGARPS